MCEFCKNEALVKGFKDEQFPREVRYCPVCGDSFHIGEFFRRLNDYTKNLLMETVEVDGEVLEYVKVPSKGTDGVSKPLSMAIDLDKVNIDRELEMLDALDFMDNHLRQHAASKINRLMEERGFIDHE